MAIESTTIANAASGSASSGAGGAKKALFGIIGEFPDVDAIMSAAERVRKEGFHRWDVHSPFPIHGIDQAMGTQPTVLPWIVLCGGLTGLTTGCLLAWYANTVSYPYFISGKPIWSFAAHIPVIFELTVLFSAFSAVLGMLMLNKLPRLYHPMFKSERFRRVTSDRFFLVVDAQDAKFDREKTAALLKSLGATHVEEIER